MNVGDGTGGNMVIIALVIIALILAFLSHHDYVHGLLLECLFPLDGGRLPHRNLRLYSTRILVDARM